MPLILAKQFNLFAHKLHIKLALLRLQCGEDFLRDDRSRSETKNESCNARREAADIELHKTRHAMVELHNRQTTL